MGKGKIIVAIIFLVLAVGALIGYKFYGDKLLEIIGVVNQNVEEEKPKVSEKQKEPEKKEVKIFKGDDRPIAVMIDNHDEARPQVAINKAYIVYELVVEGGYTRMMPIFKGEDIKEIGPIRSARHYFLDYALEHDAIYVHFGQSPQAESDIKKLKVDNVSGIIQKPTDFWRVKEGKYAPHNVLSSTAKIKTIAEAMGHSLKSTKKSVLKYNADEVNLKDGQDALEAYIPFSDFQNVKFEYNKETKRYIKYANGKKQTDWRTKEETTFKNIIIAFAQYYDLNDGSGKGRQGLTNLKTLDGYYITNGKVIKITCEKKSRDGQTVYKNLDGKEIELNDGNTYIGICPLDSEVTFKGEPEPDILQDN